jgi:hypothetical protein
MKKTSNSRPMFEHEKQFVPMGNEVDPKNAFVKISTAVNKAAKRCKIDSPKQPKK